MIEPRFQSATDAIDAWRENLTNGTPPKLYRAGTGELAKLEIGPGLVSLFGGAPGAGKTAFTMQLVVDALRTTETLRALVCNIEMPPGILLDRQLSRLTGIPATLIRYRQLKPEHGDAVDQGMDTLESLGERLAFVRPPFTLENVAASADAFRADLLLLDYLQRIPPPNHQGDMRAGINATMDFLRQFADADIAVMVVSSVGRSRDGRGRSTYAGDALSLASFKESGELEYGADDAYMLVPDANDEDKIILRQLKSRHGEQRDIPLLFDKRCQRFKPEDNSPTPEKADVRRALAKLWKPAAACSDDGED